VARGHQVPAREGVEKPLHSRRFILRRPSPWNQRGGSEEAVSPFFRELRRQPGSRGNDPRASKPIGDERCRNVLELEQRRVTALDHDRCRAGPRPGAASGRTSRRSSQHTDRYRMDQSIRALSQQVGKLAKGQVGAPIEFPYPRPSACWSADRSWEPGSAAALGNGSPPGVVSDREHLQPGS
jgi:hypothetical protein